jgi:pimeloyl-ACP methyl ester carboxylesterase
LLTVLEDFDMTEECKQIRYKTLVMNGEFDEAQDNVVLPWLEGIPGAKRAHIEGVAHLALDEKPDEYIQIISDFLNSH